MNNLSLNGELQNLIRVLEQIGERAGVHSDMLYELLDQLYQQKMDLTTVALQPTSPHYKQAAESLHCVCGKLKAAQRDKSRLAEALRSVSDVTSKLNRVLDNAV